MFSHSIYFYIWINCVKSAHCVLKLQTVFKHAVFLYFGVSANLFKGSGFHIRTPSSEEGKKEGREEMLKWSCLSYLLWRLWTPHKSCFTSPSLHHQPMSCMDLAAVDELQQWLSNQCTLWSKVCCLDRAGKELSCKRGENESYAEYNK